MGSVRIALLLFAKHRLMLRWWRILRQCATRRCKSLTINNAMRTLPLMLKFLPRFFQKAGGVGGEAPRFTQNPA